LILKTTIVVCEIKKLLCNECIFLMGLYHPEDVTHIRKPAVHRACSMALLMLATEFTSVSRYTASIMLFRAHVSSTSHTSSVSRSCSAFTSAARLALVRPVSTPGSCTSSSSFSLWCGARVCTEASRHCQRVRRARLHVR